MSVAPTPSTKSATTSTTVATNPSAVPTSTFCTMALATCSASIVNTTLNTKALCACIVLHPNRTDSPIKKGGFIIILRGRELHPRPQGYEPCELLLLNPAMPAVYQIAPNSSNTRL